MNEWIIGQPLRLLSAPSKSCADSSLLCTDLIYSATLHLDLLTILTLLVTWKFTSIASSTYRYKPYMIDWLIVWLTDPLLVILPQLLLRTFRFSKVKFWLLSYQQLTIVLPRGRLILVYSELLASLSNRINDETTVIKLVDVWEMLVIIFLQRDTNEARISYSWF